MTNPVEKDASDAKAPAGAQSHPAWVLLMLAVVAAIVYGILEGGGRYVTRQRETSLLKTSPHLNWTSAHQFDPDLMWALKPNLKDIDQGFPFSGHVTTWKVCTNELGLRGPSPDQAHKRLRVLALGDSRTFGMGVEDNKTWPAQVQQILDRDAPGKYEVINAGVTGYTVMQGYNYLRLRGLKLEPDVVMVTFGYNEGATVPPPGIGDWYWENPQAHSGFVTVLKRALEGAGLARPEPFDYLDRRLSPGRLLDTLIAFDELCRSKEIKLIYVLWPSFPELTGEQFDRPFLTDVVQQAARTVRAPFINVTEPLQTAGKPIFLDDIHLNAEGNRLVSEKLAAGLNQIVTSPKPVAPEMLQLPGAPPEDTEGQIAHFTRLLTLNPYYSLLVHRLDTALIAANDPARRVAFWRGMCPKFPEAGRMQYHLALALAQAGQNDDVAPALAKAIELIPHDMDFLLTAGEDTLRLNLPSVMPALMTAILNNNPIPQLWDRIRGQMERMTKAGLSWKDIEPKINHDVTLPDALLAEFRQKYGN